MEPFAHLMLAPMLNELPVLSKHLQRLTISVMRLRAELIELLVSAALPVLAVISLDRCAMPRAAYSLVTSLGRVPRVMQLLVQRCSLHSGANVEGQCRKAAGATAWQQCSLHRYDDVDSLELMQMQQFAAAMGIQGLQLEAPAGELEVWHGQDDLLGEDTDRSEDDDDYEEEDEEEWEWDPTDEEEEDWDSADEGEEEMEVDG
eukprot:CAMPEP_0202909102 /NCGR_PEP_ID=MMETSP1392-20130828/48296_1 /ASSEMBLY_ACC=CAM_ASM_000868 /TAXON_ID=225041 /ORGANISM="Chlamydomonas chlamydogama, Strain SAG 11-48b" /LENGTH=202 /DNA_ID=CAMNT_0049598735 /DNA_START=5 /DNA_END=613 /DNA_ORIENTATION=-